MTIVDLTGMMITELLAFPAVTNIVGQKVRSEWAQGESPPGVLVARIGIDYNPGGGTRRLGLQAPIYVAQCFGATRPQADQLANAVVEAVNMRGPRKNATGKLVWQSTVESGDVAVDPTTKWPHADVVFTYLGAQQAAVV